jgi:hypothetical protein
LCFVVGLIPLTGKFAVSDSARIRVLSKDGPECDRWCAVMLLAGASRSGVRPRDMNPQLIGQSPGPADGSGDWIVASLFRYNSLIDTELEDAQRDARESLIYCYRIDDLGAVITIRERTEELLREINDARPHGAR